jgi:branched-chain amino acid transport system permease protein
LLVLSAAVSGVGVGFLYGLLGFAIVLLYKSTGVANFAQGAMATVGAFVVLKVLLAQGMGLLTAVVVGGLGCAVLGVLIYLSVLRPRASSAGGLNMTVRTLGLSLLLAAALDAKWGEGAPFQFPALVTGNGLKIGSVVVTSQTVVAVAVTVAITGAFALLFRFTSIGLVYRAVAERPDVARLLGLRTEVLAGLAWALSGLVSLVVGVLVAPSALLSTHMMEAYLLYAFAGVVLGGLTSLVGAVVGGVLVGVVSNVVAVLLNGDWASVAIFVLLVVTLALRPAGLFGEPDVARL